MASFREQLRELQRPQPFTKDDCEEEQLLSNGISSGTTPIVVNIIKDFTNYSFERVTLTHICPYFNVDDILRTIYIVKNNNPKYHPDYVFLGVRKKDEPLNKDTIYLSASRIWLDESKKDDQVIKLYNPAHVIRNGIIQYDFVDVDGQQRDVFFNNRNRVILEDISDFQDCVFDLYTLHDLLVGFDNIQPLTFYGTIFPYFPNVTMNQIQPSDDNISALNHAIIYFKKRYNQIKYVNRLLCNPRYIKNFEVKGIKQLMFGWNHIQEDFEGCDILFFDTMVNEVRPFSRLIPMYGNPISKLYKPDELAPPFISNTELLKTWVKEKSPDQFNNFFFIKVLLEKSDDGNHMFGTLRVFDDGTGDFVMMPPKNIAEFKPDTVPEVLDEDNVFVKMLEGLPFQLDEASLKRASLSLQLNVGNEFPIITEEKLRKRLPLLQTFFQEIQPPVNEKPLLMLRYKMVSNFVLEDTIHSFITLIDNREKSAGKVMNVSDLSQKISENFGISISDAKEKITKWVTNKDNIMITSTEQKEYMHSVNGGTDITLYASHPTYRVNIYNLQGASHLRRIVTLLSLLFLMDDEVSTNKYAKDAYITEDYVRYEREVIPTAEDVVSGVPSLHVVTENVSDESSSDENVLDMEELGSNSDSEDESSSSSNEEQSLRNAPILKAPVEEKPAEAEEPLMDFSNFEEESNSSDEEETQEEKPVEEKPVEEEKEELMDFANFEEDSNNQSGGAKEKTKTGFLTKLKKKPVKKEESNSDSNSNNSNSNDEKPAMKTIAPVIVPPKTGIHLETTDAGKTIVSTKEYYIGLLREKDKALFPSDYTGKCQAPQFKQPLTMDKAQWEYNYYTYADERSKYYDPSLAFIIYGTPETEAQINYVKNNAIPKEKVVTSLRYGSDPHNPNYYFCPKYYCIRDRIFIPVLHFESDTFPYENKLRRKEKNQCPFCNGKLIQKKDSPQMGETVLFRGTHLNKEMLYVSFHPSKDYKYSLPCCYSKRDDDLLFEDPRFAEMKAITEGLSTKQVKKKKKESVVDYNLLETKIKNAYILGSERYPLDIPTSEDDKKAKIGICNKGLDNYFGQDSTTLAIRTTIRQELNPTAEGFFRVGVPNGIEEVNDSFLSSLMPLFNKQTVASLKEYIIKKITPRVFMSLNFGNLVLEFYTPETKMSDKEVKERARDPSLKLYFDDDNVESAIETNVTSTVNMELKRLFIAYDNFINYIRSTDIKKEYRHFVHALAEPNLLFEEGPGITIIELQYKGDPFSPDTKIDVKCPILGYDSLRYSKNNVAFITHYKGVLNNEYRDIWEPLIYVKQISIPGKLEKSQKGIYSLSPRTLVDSLPTVKERVREFKTQCSSLYRGFYTIQRDISYKLIHPYSYVKEKLQPKFRIGRILRDLYNHIIGVTVEIRKSEVIIPVVDDGTIDTNNIVSFGYSSIGKLASANLYYEVYQSIGPLFRSNSPYYEITSFYKDKYTNKVYEVRLGPNLRIPCGDFREPIEGLTIPIEVPGNRADYMIEDETVFQEEEFRTKNIMEKEQLEELYEHLRLIFSQWMKRSGPHVEQLIEAILNEKNQTYFQKREKLKVIFSPFIVTWLYKDSSVVQPISYLIRKDCLSIKDPQKCGGICKWKSDENSCLLHIPNMSHQEDIYKAPIENVFILRLMDEIIRAHTKRQEIFQQRISRILMPKTNMYIDQEWILPDGVPSYSKLLGSEKAVEEKNRPLFFEEFSRMNGETTEEDVEIKPIQESYKKYFSEIYMDELGIYGVPQFRKAGNVKDILYYLGLLDKIKTKYSEEQIQEFFPMKNHIFPQMGLNIISEMLQCMVVQIYDENIEMGVVDDVYKERVLCIFPNYNENEAGVLLKKNTFEKYFTPSYFSNTMRKQFNDHPVDRIVLEKPKPIVQSAFPVVVAPTKEEEEKKLREQKYAEFFRKQKAKEQEKPVAVAEVPKPVAALAPLPPIATPKPKSLSKRISELTKEPVTPVTPVTKPKTIAELSKAVIAKATAETPKPVAAPPPPIPKPVEPLKIKTPSIFQKLKEEKKKEQSSLVPEVSEEAPKTPVADQASLDPAKFVKIDIKPDGWCLYSALLRGKRYLENPNISLDELRDNSKEKVHRDIDESLQFIRTILIPMIQDTEHPAELHQSIRRQIEDEQIKNMKRDTPIKKFKEFVRKLMETTDETNPYAGPRIWGTTDIQGNAFALHYNILVNAYILKEGKYQIQYSSAPLHTVLPTKKIHLLYNGIDHFDLLIPKQVADENSNSSNDSDSSDNSSNNSNNSSNNNSNAKTVASVPATPYYEKQDNNSNLRTPRPTRRLRFKNEEGGPIANVRTFTVNKRMKPGQQPAKTRIQINPKNIEALQSGKLKPSQLKEKLYKEREAKGLLTPRELQKKEKDKSLMDDIFAKLASGEYVISANGIPVPAK